MTGKRTIKSKGGMMKRCQWGPAIAVILSLLSNNASYAMIKNREKKSENCPYLVLVYNSERSIDRNNEKVRPAAVYSMDIPNNNHTLMKRDGNAISLVEANTNFYGNNLRGLFLVNILWPLGKAGEEKFEEFGHDQDPVARVWSRTPHKRWHEISKSFEGLMKDEDLRDTIMAAIYGLAGHLYQEFCDRFLIFPDMDASWEIPEWLSKERGKMSNNPRRLCFDLFYARGSRFTNRFKSSTWDAAAFLIIRRQNTIHRGKALYNSFVSLYDHLLSRTIFSNHLDRNIRIKWEFFDLYVDISPVNSDRPRGKERNTYSHQSVHVDALVPPNYTPYPTMPTPVYQHRYLHGPATPIQVVPTLGTPIYPHRQSFRGYAHMSTLWFPYYTLSKCIPTPCSDLYSTSKCSTSSLLLPTST